MSSIAALRADDPAFPCGELHDDPGLTARELIAVECMARLVSLTNISAEPAKLQVQMAQAARASVIAADALVEALSDPTHQPPKRRRRVATAE